MTTDAAELLTQNMGEIYENYSGRGMYGKKTTGIQYDQMSEFYDEVAFILEEGEQEEREIVAEAIRNIKTDSLGLGIIVY